MTKGLHQRFDAPGLAADDRFEYWRGWYSDAIDVPMQLEPVRRLPYAFDASAEALTIGAVDIVEYRFGAAVGSWTGEAIMATDRLRLVILAPTPAATGSWYDRRVSLADGAAVLLGETEGRWQTREGLHGIQVNVPRQAVPVTEAQLAAFADPRRLRSDPTFSGLVRPALLGLAGHLGALSNTDVPELQQLWISLLTMLTRSLAGRDTAGVDTAPARRLQVRRYIRAHLADPRLSPTTIADALHISRSTLYAALPADSGGVAAEVRRQRLERAHTLLRDPANTQPIAEIAASVGIPSAAQFSRAFRERYALSPRQLRPDRPSAPRARRRAAGRADSSETQP
jgi:AraC-like DNA-binding protein